MKKSETLGFQRRPYQAYSSDIATWPIEAGNKARFYRISGAYEHYRNCSGGRSGRSRGFGAADCKDYGNPSPHEILCQRRQSVRMTLGPTVFNCKIPPIDIARRIQRILERSI